MPQDIVVRESRGLYVLLALFAVIMLAVLLPLVFQKLAVGNWTGGDMLLAGLCALFIYGLPMSVKSAWQRKVVLVAFDRGLFWPLLHPDVIPWGRVESVWLNRFGPGTSVYIVFSSGIEAKVRMTWLARFMASARRFVTGRHFSGLHDHSNRAVVHAIDDWILYEKRQAPKPRYTPGIVDALLRRLG